MRISKKRFEALEKRVADLEKQVQRILDKEVRETGKKKAKKKQAKKKQAASGGKQSVSQKELSYLRKCADSSVTVAFAGHRPLKPQ